MSDLQERLQNLNWADSFENIELDLALHPDVFNMFVDACNERLATCLRLDELIPQVRWRPLPNQEIDGLWNRFYGDSFYGGIYTPGQGPEYATTARQIYQLPRTNSTIKVEHKSICALGIPNLQFEHVFSIFDRMTEYPTPYNFNIKTTLFDLKQTAPVNTWPWLQSIVAYICFFFIKEPVDNRTRYYSWRSPYFTDCAKEDLTTCLPRFFGLSGLYDLPEDRYGTKDFFVPKIFRRVYPRTIVRLDDSGEQGQIARLIPHYSQALDSEYKNIKFNYHKLYIYDTETGTVKFDGDGNPIFSNWRLLTYEEAKTIRNPDMITSFGFAQRGDYFGPWILEDMKTALNLCQYASPREAMQVVFDYSSTNNASQSYNQLSPAFDLQAIALELDRPAEVGDILLFLKKADSRLKVGQYALTGGPNKIFEIIKEIVILENPVSVRMTQSVSFSENRRTGIYDYISPLNRFLEIPLLYSGDIPILGANSGIYYPGFDQLSYSINASGAPVKTGSFVSQWTYSHPSGTVTTYKFLTFFDPNYAKKLKAIHYLRGSDVTYIQSETQTENLIDWLMSKGLTSIWPGYDLASLKSLSYEQDSVYGVELQNTMIWDRILLEFEFQYRGD